MGELTHPAPFSATIMDQLADIIADWKGPILDPYAGTNRIAELTSTATIGIEIEEDWARRHGCVWGNSKTLRPVDETTMIVEEPYDFVNTIQGRRESLPRPRAVCFSPDYGNRFADQYLGTPEEQEHRAKTGQLPRRRSYAISLGRKVTDGSTCRHKFGPKYRAMHAEIMTAVTSVMLRPAKIACNVSDFYETVETDRGSQRVHVVSFWLELLASLGWVIERMVPVTTSRFRDGANSDLRADAETILVGHLPGGES